MSEFKDNANISITESQISDFGSYEPVDSTILRSADIGITVQAFDANILTTSDIGSTVQSFNANTVVDANYVSFDPNGTYANLRAQGTTAEDVGLGNVINESNETMFTNAALTGVPTAPTPAASTNTTQIATAAFVQSEITAAGLALGTNYAVADIAARDNLTGLVVGDVVFVADDGDNK